jgi:hypothetical protein
MNMDSDMAILDATVKAGDVWSFPALDNFRANLSGLSGFQAAEAWCSMVRGAHERQEGEATAKREQEALLRGGNARKNTRAPVRGGDVLRTGEDLQVSEISMDEYLKARLTYLNNEADKIQEMYNEAKQAKNRAKAMQGELAREVKKIRSLLDASAREDADEVGEDLRTQVRGGEPEGGGDMGGEDSAEGAPQETSEQSQGDS